MALLEFWLGAGTGVCVVSTGYVMRSGANTEDVGAVDVGRHYRLPNLKTMETCTNPPLLNMLDLNSPNGSSLNLDKQLSRRQKLKVLHPIPALHQHHCRHRSSHSHIYSL
jgi:hypothetical protein